MSSNKSSINTMLKNYFLFLTFKFSENRGVVFFINSFYISPKRERERESILKVTNWYKRHESIVIRPRTSILT